MGVVVSEVMTFERRRGPTFVLWADMTSRIEQPQPVVQRRMSNLRSDTDPGNYSDVMERSEVRVKVPSIFMKRWKRCSPRR